MTHKSSPIGTGLKIIAIFLLIYCFLLSINLMGSAFRLFGEGFAERLFALASNRFIGLFVGILTTALVQSSSFTTSMVVGLVGGGVLDIGHAIPIIMGANIGTSVTNSLVAIGHITRKDEYRRAVESGVVHDIFNVMAVLVLFPLEMVFGMLEASAREATKLFGGAGGATFTSPLKAAIKPVSHFLEGAATSLPVPAQIHATIIFTVSIAILFLSLYWIVKVLKSLILSKVEAFFSTYIFRNALLSLFVGMALTALVQSSSVTTSLIVPMAAAGILTLEQIFPYTLGANVGTTITAILASMATVSADNMGGVTIAFSHLLFNIFGILIFYPFRFIPIGMAREVGRRTLENRFFPVLYVAVVFFCIPGLCIYVTEVGVTWVSILSVAGFPPALYLIFMCAKAIQKRRGGK